MSFNLNLNHLRTFYTVAQAKSLTGASKILHVTIAAVSLSLKALETEMGVTLIERGRSLFRLTESGEKLFAACGNIFHLFEKGYAEAKNLNKPAGLLTVGSHVHTGSHEIAGMAADLMKRYPELTVHLKLNQDYSAIIQDLKESRTDICVIGSPYFKVSEDLEGEEVARCKWVLAATPTYIKKHPPIHGAKDLARHAILDIAPDHPTLSTLSASLGPPNALTFARKIFTTSFEAAVTLMKADAGLLACHYYFVKEELKRGRLKQVLPHKAVGGYGMYVCYFKRRAGLPNIAAAREFFTRELKKLMPEKENRF